MTIDIENEVDRNFQYFQSVVADLMQQHAGEHAIIRQQEVVGFEASAVEAMTEGYRRFPDGLFSVQLVTQTPLDLGFYSHAASTRQGS